jgi:hypothetical protein
VLREGRYLILGKAGEDKVLVQDPLASRPAMMMLWTAPTLRHRCAKGWLR